MTYRYRHTIFACFLGYTVQAVVNNFLPLLFVHFGAQYGLPLSTVTFLVTFNFGLQLLTDLISPGVVDRIGTRAAVVAAHLFAAAGFVALTVLPELIAPFPGLLIAVVLYAVGGGLLEVLVSPILEACPSDNKAAAMNLMHSFYCWGVVAVILGSTLFFCLFGIQNWRILACLWTLVPLMNIWNFAVCPIGHTVEDGQGMTVRQLLKLPLFWLMCMLMVCAGSAELSMAQWASAFAESALGVSKSVGDLAGPCLFAVLMGTSRVLCSRMSD